MLWQWTWNKDLLQLQDGGALGKDKGANTNMEISATERMMVTLHNHYQLNNVWMLWQLCPRAVTITQTQPPSGGNLRCTAPVGKNYHSVLILPLNTNMEIFLRLIHLCD